MAKANPITTHRDIPGYPGYRVGDDGSVWTSLKRVARPGGGSGSCCVPGGPWRLLQPAHRRDGALHVVLRGKTHLVHHLVLVAFVGPCPDGKEACHEDDDRTNNRLANLRWDTRLSNMRDRSRNGRQPRGETHHNATLTPEQVLAIRADFGAGIRQADIARARKVSSRQVSKIVKGQRWSHLTG